MSEKFFRRKPKGTLDDVIHTLKVAPIMMLLGALVSLAVLTLPKLETKFNPVVTQITLGEIVEQENGISFSANGFKARGNCSWIETIWYFGKRDGMFATLERNPHRDPVEIRMGGWHHWETIFLPNIRAYDISNTFADTTHSCPWIFGLSREVVSHFWR